MKRVLCFLSVAFLFIAGCADMDFCNDFTDEDKDKNPIDSVISFNPNDDSASTLISFESLVPWTLKDAALIPGWMEVYPQSGETGGDITIQMTGANATNKTLEHLLTFIALDGAKLTIMVRQDALDINWHKKGHKKFTLSTRNELAGLAYLVNNGIDNFKEKTITLTGSIDLTPWSTGKGWIPIGHSSSRPFVGSFDGDGYLVSNLCVNNPDLDYVGLFGYFRGGTIKNLGVTDVKITGGNMVGSIAGLLDGSIANSFATGMVKGSIFVGGLAGWVGGSITNSYTTTSVNGSSYVGGLAGSATLSSVSDCYAAGAVNGKEVVGGVVGTMHNSSVANCVALKSSLSGLSEVRRVVGATTGTNTLNKNMARDGLTGYDTDERNGESVTDADLHTKYVYEVRLGWEFGNDDAKPWKWASPFPILYWQTTVPAQNVNTQ